MDSRYRYRFILRGYLPNKYYQKYCGFSIKSPEDDKTIYFLFTVMIYGLKTGVYVATKLTKPIVKKSNLLGIRFSIFIDDGRVLGDTKYKCENNLDQVLEILGKAGWNVNEAKTIRNASKSLYHQGMITNTDPLMYLLPQFKMEHIIRILNTNLCNLEVMYFLIKILFFLDTALR